MTVHILIAIALVPVLWSLYRVASHDMASREKLSDEEKARIQEDEAW